MTMDGNTFDSMLEEVSKQKALMEHLTQENRLLRQQLADLRSGRGILVEIGGRRFALASNDASQREYIGGLAS